MKGRLAANLRKSDPLMAEFPLARQDGPSPDFTEIWEAKCSALQRPAEPHSPPLFEKVSLFCVIRFALSWTPFAY